MTYRSFYRLIVALICALIIGFASGYQWLGESRDYRNYFEFFDLVRDSLGVGDVEYRFEPGFSFLVHALAAIGLDDFLIYTVLAFFIAFIKFGVIGKSDKYLTVFFVFLIYYLSRYVVLFEMTVLRAACAFSLVFCVFYKKENYLFNFFDFSILLISVAFHYSAVVFLPLYFIKPDGRMKLIFFVLLTFIFIYFLKNIAFLFLSDNLFVFSTYNDLGKATLIPIPFLFDIFLFVFGLVMLNSADVAMRYAVMGLGFSIAFHFALIEYSVFSNRFRELLSVFILIYIVRSAVNSVLLVRVVSLGFLLVTSPMYVYVYFIYDPLLK